MNPQHKNPTDERRKAKAPYNFVPLPDVVLPAVDTPNLLPDRDTYADKTYKNTGYFEVKLTTLSPLYIRTGLSPSEYEQAEYEQKHPPDHFRDAMRNKPDFFHMGDPNKPVIPGSSLRGMLRQLVEIITYSKVKDVPNERLVYRAVGDPSAVGDHYREKMLGKNKSSTPDTEMRFDYSSPYIKGGYLEKFGDGWAIRPAQQHLGESIVRVPYPLADTVIGGRGRSTTHTVYVRPASRSPKLRPGKRDGKDLYLNVAETQEVSATSKTGLVPATLVESGDMSGGAHPKHWHCAIYEADAGANLIPIPDELWGIYQEDRDMTRDKNRPTLKIPKDGPLFYRVDHSGKLEYFGSTVMFRLVYDKRPLDLIPLKLRDPAVVDFAEAMFGFVRTDKELDTLNPRPKQGEKGRAYGGRVSVTHATLVPDQADIWLPNKGPDKALVPRILASPKPTSFQHYLTQGNPDDKNELNHYDSDDTVLRGFKMYWAMGNSTADDLRSKPSPEDLKDEKKRRQVERVYQKLNDGSWRVKDKNSQHTQMKPVNVNKTFTFRVYFENLSDVELGALEWALRLPGTAGPYCHRLGMGKPLGMGAISLEPTLHLYQPNKRYGTLLNESNFWELGSDGDASTASYYPRFEKYVLDKLPAVVSAPSFGEIKRIQMLLKILEWRDSDPQRDYKQYMTDLRDFKARRVLPDPLYVGATQRGGGAPPWKTGPHGDRRGSGGSGRREDRPGDPPPAKAFDKPKPQKQKEITERKSTEATRSFADEFMEQLRKKQSGEESE